MRLLILDRKKRWTGMSANPLLNARKAHDTAHKNTQNDGQHT